MMFQPFAPLNENEVHKGTFNSLNDNSTQKRGFQPDAKLYIKL